ncbi:hypothetical protein BJV74DRAFT_799476 [Russula compacta]|nr:hypothetical protein BJV74DRAFT_799476 [Russula compacta]
MGKKVWGQVYGGEHMQVKADPYGQVEVREALGERSEVRWARWRWMHMGRQRETNVSTKKRKEVKDCTPNYIPAAELVLGSFGHTLFNSEGERGTGQGVRGERGAGQDVRGKAGEVEVDVHGQKQAGGGRWRKKKFGKGHTLFNLRQEREALGKRPEMRWAEHKNLLQITNSALKIIILVVAPQYYSPWAGDA